MAEASPSSPVWRSSSSMPITPHTARLSGRAGGGGQLYRSASGGSRAGARARLRITEEDFLSQIDGGGIFSRNFRAWTA
jgi:hypothetical protein